jgi:hypothetical protein
MFWRHFGFEFVLLLILCTAGLFFFPVAHGSYSAVHGPVTALQSIKTRLQMWAMMAVAACSPTVKRLFAADSRHPFQAGATIASILSSSDQIFVLRC